MVRRAVDVHFIIDRSIDNKRLSNPSIRKSLPSARSFLFSNSFAKVLKSFLFFRRINLTRLEFRKFELLHGKYRIEICIEHFYSNNLITIVIKKRYSPFKKLLLIRNNNREILSRSKKKKRISSPFFRRKKICGKSVAKKELCAISHLPFILVSERREEITTVYVALSPPLFSSLRIVRIYNAPRVSSWTGFSRAKYRYIFPLFNLIVPWN